MGSFLIRSTKSLPYSSGFTLLEVLFTLAITALLLGAITLNVGVRSSLIKASSTGDPITELSQRISEITHTNTITELEKTIGKAARDNPLTDPATSTNRKLVTIERVNLNAGSQATTVLAVTVENGDSSVTRWLTPSDNP